MAQLLSILPKLLHPGIRSSKYYARRNDCLSLQAQTGRSRTANAEENYQKLFEEIQSLYSNTIPGESSPEKSKKYNALYVITRSIHHPPKYTSLDWSL